MKKIKYLFIAVAALISGTAMAQKITCAGATIAQGGTAELVFSIESDKESTLAEFTLALPEGIKVQTEDDEYNYERGDMLVKSHSVTVTDKKDGSGIYVLVKNESGKNFKTTSGTLITLPIECGNNVSGTYKANVTGANIVNLEAKEIIEETAKAFDFDITVGTTGIDEVNGSRFMVSDSDFYDLSGRRVSQPTTKGIYVQDGKKVVIN